MEIISKEMIDFNDIEWENEEEVFPKYLLCRIGTQNSLILLSNVKINENPFSDRLTIMVYGDDKKSFSIGNHLKETGYFSDSDYVKIRKNDISKEIIFKDLLEEVKESITYNIEEFITNGKD